MRRWFAVVDKHKRVLYGARRGARRISARPRPPVYAAGGSYRLKSASQEPPVATPERSRFTGFRRFLYDHSPCRPASLSRLHLCRALCLCQRAAPAAAIAADTRPASFWISRDGGAQAAGESANQPAHTSPRYAVGLWQAQHPA